MQRYPSPKLAAGMLFLHLKNSVKNGKNTKNCKYFENG